MFRLQVAAPGNRVRKFRVVRFEEPDGFRIRDARERVVADVVQAVEQALIDEAIAECKILRTGLHDIFDHGFHHRLGQFHDVLEAGKRDLRLNHPELGRMALRVGFFRAERRAERINLAERHRHALRFQLAGDGQAGRLAEKVLRIIDRAVLLARRVVGGQRRDAEHLPRALAVAGGD